MALRFLATRVFTIICILWTGAHVGFCQTLTEGIPMLEKLVELARSQPSGRFEGVDTHLANGASAGKACFFQLRRDPPSPRNPGVRYMLSCGTVDDSVRSISVYVDSKFNVFNVSGEGVRGNDLRFEETDAHDDSFATRYIRIDTTRNGQPRMVWAHYTGDRAGRSLPRTLEIKLRLRE